MEQSSVDEAFVEPLALVDLAHHELAAEAIVFVQRLDKVFLVERLEKFWVARVDAPVLLQALEQSLCHVLEVTAHIKVVKRDTVFAYEIEMIKDEVLRLQLKLHSFESIVEKQRSF